MVQLLSYFRASLALWRRQWVGVLVALAGLSVAFAISMIAVFYVLDGYTSDSWLKDSERLYRIESYVLSNGSKTGFYRNVRAKEQHADYVRENFPEVEAVTRIQEYTFIVEVDGKEEKVYYHLADANLTDVLDFPVVEGDIAAALANPDGAILSRSKAQEMFGRDDATVLGETFTLGREVFDEDRNIVKIYRDYSIGAIIEDNPANSSFDLNVVLSRPIDLPIYTFPVTSTFLKLREGTDFASFKPRFEKQLTDNTPPYRVFTFEFYLEPLVGATIRPNVVIATGGRIVIPRILWTTVSVALILFLTAGFNYIAVFTAINSLRGREVAVRRIAGASYRHIFVMCLLEGILLASLTYTAALLIADDLTGIYKDFTYVNVPILVAYRWPQLLAGWGVVALLGILGALYPAYIMRRARPETLLRGGQSAVAGGRGRMRQMLVGMQAFACVGVLIAGLQAAWQTNYVISVDRGFETDDVFFLKAPVQADVGRFQNSFLTEIRKLSGVKVADTSATALFGGIRFTSHYRGPNQAESKRVALYFSGPGFFNILKNPPLARLDIPAGENQIVIPVSALSSYGFKTPDGALGQTLVDTDSITEDNAGDRYMIVAVIKDLKDGLSSDPETTRAYHVGVEQRINFITGQTTGLSPADFNAILKPKWEEFFPDQPYEVEWMTDLIAARYNSVQDMGRVFNFISVIILILSVAGLYGMARHWLLTRRRELALRRVMGAEHRALIMLAVRKMLTPILIGGLLAFVPVWLLMQEWLTTFTDKGELPLILYGMVLVAVTLLSAVILLGHTLRALREHPAEVLYHE